MQDDHKTKEQLMVEMNELRNHVAELEKDITQRKQVEEVMKRYELLSENALEIILFISEDGRILEANEAALRAYGYDRQ